MKNHMEILAVKKDGIEYHWFSLMTKEGANYQVHDVNWIIDESVENAYISKSSIEPNYPETIRNCEIIGNSKQISNLMISLGWGTPEHSTDSIFALSLADAVRSFQGCIYQLEELVKSKSVTHED